MTPDEPTELAAVKAERDRYRRRAEIAESTLAEREVTAEQRRLLAISRMVFDGIAEGRPFTRAEAADLAQRIVDEIGHSITEEPALGPSYREQIGQLRAALEGAAFVSIAPDDLARYLAKWEDTLAFCEEYFTKKAEANAAVHANPKVFYSPLGQRVSTALPEVRRLKDIAETEQDGTAS